MKHGKNLGGAAILSALLSTTAAHADVTAEELWQSWVDMAVEMGQTVTSASQQMSGDTLVVSGVTFSAEMPDGALQVTLPEVRLRELGDGSVEITTSENIPMTVTSSPATGESVSIPMFLRHSGLTTLASGAPGDMTYDVAAAEMGFGMNGMTVDGETIELLLDVALKGNTAQYRVVGIDDRIVNSTFATDAVTFAMTAKDPEGTGNFNMTGDIATLAGSSEMTLPRGTGMGDMNAALKAGFELSSTYTRGATAMAFDFQDGSDTMQATVKEGGGSVDVSLSPDGLSYGTTGAASEIVVTNSMMPFPIEASMAEMAFNLTMPVAKSDEVKPFGLLVKLVDLKVSDAIWSMFDPMAQLPRDPATLVVDVTGEAKSNLDVFDPEAAAAIMGPPGEVHALDVNEVRVTFAGAELTGEGGFTFDNADMSMGYPKPLGALDLMLVGGNGLMDKLVAMGLLPEEQVMGARMMMGMFAVPSGDDTLTSKIEFRDDGGLYANGQRLQ